MGTTADKLQHLIDGKQLIVDSTNTKANTNHTITSKWTDIADSIYGITTGIDTSDATAVSSDILLGKTAYGTDGKLTGTIETYNGDYIGVAEDPGIGVFPSGTLSITENGGYDVTYYKNVVVDVQTGANTSDATAIASDILLGKTAYGSDGKLTGTIPTYGGVYVENEIANKGLTLDTIATGGIKGEVKLTSTTIIAYAFYNNAGITSIYAPNVTSVQTYNFNTSTGITNIYLPNCTSIATECFKNTQITSLSLPECTSIGNNSFTTPKKLAVIDIPKCKTIGNSSFAQSIITRLVVPECTSIGNSTLSNCTKLTFADLGKCKNLVRFALRNNSLLKTVILRSETICTCALNVLDSTPIAKGTGYIYVPRALLSDTDSTSDYRQATNWARFAAQFRALEDYTVDGTITGTLDESKI